MNDVPKHVAFIMDGNGRWAKSKKLPRSAGHKKGSETLRDIVEYAATLKIKYITAYTFSTENWSRPKEEVSAIMALLEDYLDDALKKSKKRDIKIRVIGKLEGLSDSIIHKIKKLELITKDKPGLCVIFAINYGGRDEIVRATKIIAEKFKQGTITEITEEVFAQFLDTGNVPDPDFLIRTSGELRTSNFLPWQLAYSEFYFTDKHWPDFSKEDFDLALLEYANRKRRFGKTV
ncbi:isoprenyl transferase [Candidatus Epulonipiscium viviparus]|uniref:isoprenyl transferase n=1 Tax=Candidatus Epulonipiscium viviparus TaxID=420336 RepID=UPI0027381039|nr:isoprenyl transferase [Candidatus Epulopiscium viviparus]